MAKSKTHAEQAEDLVFEKGLPASVDTERLCLGAVMLDAAKWDVLSSVLKAEDFSLEKHRRIFNRMSDLAARGVRIDRVTLIEELMAQGQLESVDGMTYLVSLDEGLPEIVALNQYALIVKEKADLRRIIFAAQASIDRALHGEAKAKDIAQAASIALEAAQIGVKDDDPGRTPQQVIEEYPGGPNAFLDPSHRKKGLTTGWHRFDEMTAGLHNGDLIILAARPSMGKTALMVNIAEHLCLAPSPRHMAIFSLEMSADQLLTRMLCSQARVDQHKFRAGYLNADDRYKLQKALSQLMDAPLVIYDNSALDDDDICRLIRRRKKAGTLDIVGVDYLQLLSTKKPGENRNLELSGITRKFKIVAKECQVPFIALSQLSRNNEKRVGSKVPILSDLRDSGAIEQDADVVAFIHREEIYKKDDESVKGLADLIIAKQRNGPIGTVGLRFLGQFTRFENRFEDGPKEEFAAAEEPPPASPTPTEDW